MSAKRQRSTPKWRRNTLNTAVALAISGMCSASAWSAACAPTIDTTVAGCDASGVTPLTITTVGTVSVTAGSSLLYTGALSGSLSNSGHITAGNAITSNTYAAGVWVLTDLSGLLINSGTIGGTAISTSGSSVSAYGINVGSAMSGFLANNDIIHATATNTGSGFATAYGIRIASNLGGTLANSGTISAVATNGALNSSARAYASGVYVNGSLTGFLTNGGTISASAIATKYIAFAHGVATLGNLSGTLINSGTIRASAKANNCSARAYGIAAENGIAGFLTNSGTISASAIASKSTAAAYGVDTRGNLSGTLTNSGTISARASATTRAYAYGVNAGTLDGTLSNSGTIYGVSSRAARGYSINATSGFGSIINQAGGVLIGNLYAGGTINVTNAGDIYLPTLPAGSNAVVGGNYTQAATGMLRLDASSLTNYTQLAVGGTADLTAAATVDPVVTATFTEHAVIGHHLAVGDVLTNVVNAVTLSGGLAAGTAVAVNSYGPLATFTAAVNAGATGIDVTVASATSMSSLYGLLGTLGSNLDNYIYGANADTDKLVDALNNLTSTGQMTGAMQDLQPLMSGQMDKATAGVLHDVNRVIRAHQDDRKGMSSGDSFVTNRNAWAKLMGSWAKQNDKGVVMGYKADTSGIALGVDGELSSTSRVGVALALTNTKVDSNTNHQEVKMGSYQLIGYGSHSMNASTGLDWQVDYGSNTNKGNRNLQSVGLNSASADYKSSSVYLGAGVGRSMAMGSATTLIPTARVDYTRISEDAYTDALGSATSSRNTSEFVIGLEGKLSHALSDTTKLIANLGVDYNTQAKQSSISTTLGGGAASFTAQGISPSKTTIVGGVGVVINASKTMEVTARYDIESRSGFSAQAASVKLKVPF